MPVPPAGFAVRRIGPADAGALIALAATDNLFDEDPGTAPSGELNPDGARAFLADPSVLFWLAESGGQAMGFLHCCIQRRRTPGPVDVHPDRDRFRDGEPVDGHGRTALGPATAGPAAERRELHVVPVSRRATQCERRAPQHPRAVDPAFGHVVDVVGGDVLEVAGDRVEPESVGAIHIPEADPAVRAMREVFGATVQPGSVKPLN